MVGCNRLIAAYMRPHCRIHSFVFESKAITLVNCAKTTCLAHIPCASVYVRLCLPMHASAHVCVSPSSLFGLCVFVTLLYLSAALRVYACAPVRVCLVSCRVRTLNSSSNSLTHTHTYASKKTDFNSDSSLTDSAYRALLLLLLFFLIFQLAVGFQTHSHMLMHAHTRTLRQNNKNIRFQVPPAIVQYMRTLHAHTHRIHAQNVVCTTVCILYFSHSHHIEFQLHTHTWTACIICAHTRNFVHVWVRARVFVYICRLLLNVNVFKHMPRTQK